ncbi:MAG: hypothetical protein EZS28_038601, partial [Streblomastix strix]
MFSDEITKLEEQLRKKILHIPLKGYYLTDNELIKSQLLSENKNGTFVIMSFEHITHELKQDYGKVSDIFVRLMREQCSKDELKLMDYGLIGVSQ